VKDLKPGGRRRLNDSQLVSFNGKGWHLFDFREKQSEVYEPQLTLAQRLEVLRLQQAADLEASASAAPPAGDAMRHPKDWPLAARVWFYQAGINNDNIRDLGAFWHPRMRRVVVPYSTVTGDNAWIARDPSWSRDSLGPKYLFPQGVKRGGGALFEHKYPNAAGIALVEDVLSAYRIQRDTDLHAIAVQGTSLDREAVVALSIVSARDAIPVFTWLDPDKYGQMGARRIRDDLGRLGVEARNIVTPKDPKLHEPHEIREALEV
jgi:hypothetical protein